jgi:hypothetical protein
MGGSLSITTCADRRGSKRSSKRNNFSIRFDAYNNRLSTSFGGYQSPFRGLHPSYPPEMEDFPSEYTILIPILLACCRRPEAERDFGILNSPTYGPPDLASILTSIFSKHLDSGDHATPTPHGLLRSHCHGDRVLIVSPIDPPQNGNRIGRSQRRQIKWEGSHANASQI